MWLSRGNLTVKDGTLQFTTAGDSGMEAGQYDIPYQAVSCFIIGPGSTISHDVFRILARHGTGLVISGSDGVRMYASMPKGPDASALARSQVRHWADRRAAAVEVARKMYRWRLNTEVPEADLAVLRGIEGSRVRETYRVLAQRYGLRWEGRRYDRANPTATDPVNLAINHAATAVRAAAEVAVAACGALPQLGFIHEDSGIAFCLDIADLYRESVTLPCAFLGVRSYQSKGGDLEHIVRVGTGSELRKQKTISDMISRIKELFHADDGGGDA